MFGLSDTFKKSTVLMSNTCAKSQLEEITNKQEIY